MKKINLLGITLRDYPLREALRQADGYLENGAMNTIVCVTTRMLMKAGGDEAQKEWLEAADMTVFCESDILRAAGMTGRNRVKEIENNAFIREFIKKLARERRSVYLLEDTDENLENLEQYLREIREILLVKGKNIYTGTEEGISEDSIINDINDVAPDVIISGLPYPLQEQFLQDNRSKINGNIWMVLTKETRKYESGEKRLADFGRKIRRKLFQRRVHRYKGKVSGN